MSAESRVAQIDSTRERDPDPVLAWRRAQRGLAALLALAALLRVLLVLGGGQGYWPDENRYLRSFSMLMAIANGEGRTALESLALSPDHTGFTFFGSVPAALQAGWLALRGEPPRVATFARSAKVAALVLSLASLAVIALVFGLAQRAGAGPSEALLAAALAAGSNSLFYFSRHLHPYDLSLAFNLFALCLALERGRRLRDAFAVGVAAGAGFATYNGAWIGSGIACVAVVLRARGARDFASSALFAALGLASWPALFTLVTWPLSEVPLFVQTASFSELARTQADFSEGARLPFAYLWACERGLALVFGAGALAALWLGLRGGRERARPLLWLALALAVYGLLAIFSLGFERIGVFGRQVRQCVPFLCLAAAACWMQLIAPAWQRKLGPIAALALVVQVAFNFSEPLQQTFPDDFAREASARFGRLRRELSLEGPNLRRPVFGGSLPDNPNAWDPGAAIAIVNAQHLYPLRGAKALPPGRVALRAEHPMKFRPYQYEGFVPAERAILREHDISMRVIELEHAAGASSAPER